MSELITAEEARKASLKSLDTYQSPEFLKIINSIKEATEKGFFVVEVYTSAISNEEVEKLKNAGYHISVRPAGNAGIMYTLCW